MNKALDKFYEIFEPFSQSTTDLTLLSAVLVIIIVAYIIYRRVYLNKHRRLFKKIIKIEGECKDRLYSPKLALEHIVKLLKDGGYTLGELQEKLDRFRFSKKQLECEELVKFIASLKLILVPKS